MGERLFPLAFCLSLCLCGESSAHPVPNESHDRVLQVRLTPTAVVVDYVLEINEATAARELPRSEAAKVGSLKEFHETFTRYYGGVLADNFLSDLDRAPLDFHCTRHEYKIIDSFRCEYRFEAAWNPSAHETHRFTFREGNWELDDSSQLELTLTAEKSVQLLSVVAPSEQLRKLPAADRKPRDAERLRKVVATFTLGGAPLPAPSVAPPAPTPEEKTEEATAPEKPRTLLQLLFDTKQGVAMLLALAALFGAAHALTPGHGKTVVAAYLVGERGTIGHALVLGLVVTLTHTAAVILLAALLPLFFSGTSEADVQKALGMVGGLVIAGLGVWLLLCRLAGRADHVHLGGGHHHHHGEVGHSHSPSSGEPLGWWGIVLLGVGGGIVPCGDAIALLATAISWNRLALGLPLVLAFSAGLAAVLIGLGIGVVCARDLAGARWWDGPRIRRAMRVLPVVSAVLVTVLGFWMCYESVHAAG
jgi:ABC-type nickel/cobalt efflux system permease component RcnA